MAFFSALLLLLSSCTVKKVIAHAVDVGYEKPLNLSKTTVSSVTNSCHFSEVKAENQYKISAKKFISLPFLNRNNSSTLFTAYSFKINSLKAESQYIAEKIPLYILYKKMKYSLLS
ncbi:hypothetical protein [Flavobacterium suaedae]|uniref:hypothetical protein n=1 Tax=Flavobacterium suaedae TaxID=1767027 RepID=UPI001669F2D4|nr:hypothetical protein [Flavobacterium suaedae]